MDDNYFDEKLKGILESAPESQPDATAVSDMQQRLRGIPKPKKRRNFLPFLIAALFLPLLIGFGVFYKKYDALNKKVNELTQVISKEHRVDTIVEKQIIYQRDTIYNHVYHTKYITEYVKENSQEKYVGLPYSPRYSPHGFESPDNTIFNSNYNWSPGSENFSLFTKKSEPSIFSKYFLKEIAAENRQEAVVPFDPIDILLLKVESEEKITFAKEPGIPKFLNKKKKTNPAYYFTPTGFSLTLNASPYIFPSNDIGGDAKSFGLNASIELPGNRSLNIGGEWLNYNFKIKENPGLYSAFPIADPTDPTDVLHELKGNFSYLQIPVTMRQGFLKNKKIAPYITAGFVAYQPINQSFVYEYLNGSGEYKLNKSLSDGDFSIDNLRMSIGAAYSLGGQVFANAEVQYQHGFSLNSEEYFRLRYWALNLGLKYRFKS